ncbi:hypothetical protein Tco_0380297, partial [Tanacetum coccineum]
MKQITPKWRWWRIKVETTVDEGKRWPAEAGGGRPRLEVAGGSCEWVKVGDGGEGVKGLLK